MNYEWIKKIRLGLGWTQERLAREIGVSFSTVNRWERGQSAPSPLAAKNLKKLQSCQGAYNNPKRT